ncbi:O-antigen ligase family protein [Allostreptomyces psammosilenae]|uniref:O-antigen ligase n=1 Tax=Allostreptomyces psammosilenae TaxID=1892865 RepID=A0A852ZYL4_9ACTN|nr:O-antigen ligase family protein [Allostreptomyces psammosilenae]NYI07473.1 O-antigen ligase [Allostreptomyces psammosilenae]
MDQSLPAGGDVVEISGIDGAASGPPAGAGRPPGVGRRGRYRRRGVLDLLGAGLATAAAAWTLVTAAARPGAAPVPALLVLAAAALGVCAGRLWARRAPERVFGVPAALVAAVTVLAPGGLSGGPHVPPLWYGNANGALLAVAVGMACCAAWRAPGPRRHRGWLLLAAGLTGIAFVTRSSAGFTLCLLVLSGSLLLAGVRGRRGARTVLGVLAVLPVLAVAFTTALAGDKTGHAASDALRARLTDVRTTLWAEALDMAGAEPVFGVGPGRFAAHSALARADPDLLHAHSGPLERAAEQGLPGLALLGALFGWGLLALYRGGGPSRGPAPYRGAAPSLPGPAVAAPWGPVAVTGALALTAVAVHSSIDYILDFPVLLFFLGLLVGAASVRPAAGGRGGAPDGP